MKLAEIVRELSRVMQLEVDAVAAYDAATAAIGAGPVHDELELFKIEHQRHALALYDLFVRLGQNPPEIRPDVKGIVIGALTPPRPHLSALEVLEAMRGNEQLSSSVYAKALAKGLPQVIHDVLQRAHGDERHHLDWLERRISRGAGAAAGAHP
jgi:rubrerythrin